MLKPSTLLLLILFLTGCIHYQEPAEVADSFWSAMQSKNANKLKRSLTAGSHIQDDAFDNILPIGEFELGKTVIDGDKAWVDTSVEVLADKPFTLPLKTVLEREDKRWRVDYDTTVSNISKGSGLSRIIGSMKGLSDQFAKQFNGVIDELQDALPEVERELQELEQHIESQIPELEERLKEFSRELDETLKPPPQQPQESQQPEEAIEI